MWEYVRVCEKKKLHTYIYLDVQGRIYKYIVNQLKHPPCLNPILGLSRLLGSSVLRLVKVVGIYKDICRSKRMQPPRPPSKAVLPRECESVLILVLYWLGTWICRIPANRDDLWNAPGKFKLLATISTSNMYLMFNDQ